MTRTDDGIAVVVDIGSSGMRCSAYALAKRPQGTIAVSGCAAHLNRPVVDPESGTADLESTLDMVGNTVDACIRKLRAAGLADRIRAIGFASLVMNLVGLDDEGKALTPVFTYATRLDGAAAAAEHLRRLLREREDLVAAHQRTGAPVHAAFAPVQLLRLATEAPEVLARVRQWQTLSSAAAARWCGLAAAPVSFSEASWTGLLDFRRLRWDDDGSGGGVCALLAAEAEGFDPSALPALCDYDEFDGIFGGAAAVATGVLAAARVPAIAVAAAAAAKQWPELKGARIFLGVGDGVAANVGSGCITPDRLAVTVGTSAAARIVVDCSTVQLVHPDGGDGIGGGGDGGSGTSGTFRVPDGLWCYRIDRRRLIVGGALMDGGSVFEWTLRTLGFGSDCSGKKVAELEAAAAALAPASTGITVLPFFSGERAPGWNDTASGVVCGLRRSTAPHELLRAGLEAVALRLAAIVTRMRPLLPGGDGGDGGGADSNRSRGGGSGGGGSGSGGSDDSSRSSGSGGGGSNPKVAVLASGKAMEESPLWRQILCDTLALRVVPAAGNHHTARGVADLISQRMTGFTDLECALSHWEERIGSSGGGRSSSGAAAAGAAGAPHQPDIEATARYAAAGREQQRLYDLLYPADGGAGGA